MTNDNKLTTIFITRSLKEDSPLRSLEGKGYKVEGTSLLDFSPVPFDSIPSAAWLFFYSRNGVRYFFDSVRKLDILNQLKRYKIACMGSSTAQEFYDQMGVKPDFTGSGRPEETASGFMPVIQKEDVLFIKAEHSGDSVKKRISNRVDCKDLVVYSNKIKTQVQIPDSDIVIFTSPLNAKAYLEKKHLSENQKIIAIGHTTKNSLPLNLQKRAFIPEKPLERAIVELVLDIN